MKHARGFAAILLAALVAVALGLLLRHYGLGTVRVAGVSMEATLRSGDVILVTRFDYLNGAPSRGDVVECRFPGREDTYVKRVVGLPGDQVAFVDGQLLIDGAPVDEPYVYTTTEDYAASLGADEYLALGDNRAESYDSRMDDMGPIGRADILGRARWIILPLSRFGPIN